MIYIPLCFYLYPSSSIFWFRQIKFTFHYVSTYTKPKRKNVSGKAGFTFHYVSTYTDSQSVIIIADAEFTFHYVSTYT